MVHVVSWAAVRRFELWARWHELQRTARVTTLRFVSLNQRFVPWLYRVQPHIA